MALANIANTDLFYVATVVRMNQVIDIVNKLTDFNLTTTGSLTLTNPTLFNGGITLNVANGIIRGDGGLISNVRGSVVTSIPNSSLSNTTIFLNTAKPNQFSFVSNSGTLGGATRINVSIATTSSLTDTSTDNVAAIGAVYTVNQTAQYAANKANTACTNADTAQTTASAAGTAATNADNKAAAAYNHANASYLTTNAAFIRANTGSATANYAAGRANTALQNTTGTFNGTLTLTETLIATQNVQSANLKVTGLVDTASASIRSQTLTDAATINWDCSSGQIATVTLTASRTMAAPTNMKVGTYILHVIQGGTGNYNITWNAVFKWTGAVAPVLTGPAGSRDVISLVCDGTNFYGTYIPDVR